jgi:hypothetical protein
MRCLASRLAAALLALPMAWSAHAQNPSFLDLTTAGSSGWASGAYFVQISDGSTGTGVIDPFLRIQRNGSEQGFNTDASKVLDNKDGIWTHSLLTSDVPVKTLSDGNTYYQLMLDINESSSRRFVSLDTLRVYQVSAPALTSLGGLNPVWDMDSAGNTYVELNYSLNPGSGYGDMFAYIPTSVFASDPNRPYFVLYSRFGNPSTSDAGFEEWATLSVPAPPPPPPPPIPEPETYALMLAGLGAMAFVARRRKSRGN